MKKVKISFSNLQLLQDAFHWKLGQFKDPRPGYVAHNYLLREHCADFCTFLDQLAAKGSKNYNINFTSLQALAFNQLWVDQQVPIFAIGIIQQLIATFDRASKQPVAHEIY